eukprot:TRINITY_DN30201_c0_g1_i2.p1 TRINITY_DN30201_c0_g1~~TRINITY_DN30201_c0_g1_i2.p1  ORF type:complete len:460 (-),score=79.21 TRINITY_DN30201_c0_g1_i2:225-1604(-)
MDMEIESELQNILWQCRSSVEADRRAISCIDKLQAALAELGSEWLVRAFGSFANGLCMEGSDLDATCYRAKKDDEVSIPNTVDILSRLKDVLQSHPDFFVVEFVASARVPILKLRFDAALEVDLSCNNTEPLPNTQLLRAYSNLHPFVRDMLLLVKCWAKGAGVVGAKDGNLSSYSFALMTIYFMQVDPRIKLPCFSTSDFKGDVDIPPSARLGWSPTASRATMLQLFFEFYAYMFQWNSEVVAIHVGQRTDWHAPLHVQLKDLWEARLHVADPFLAHRNLNCVLKMDNELRLYSEIQSAATEMQSGVVPSGLRGLLQRTQWYPVQLPAQMSPPQFVSHVDQGWSSGMRSSGMHQMEPNLMNSWKTNVPPSPSSALIQSYGRAQVAVDDIIKYSGVPKVVGNQTRQLSLQRATMGTGHQYSQTAMTPKANGGIAHGSIIPRIVDPPAAHEIPRTKLAFS